MKGEGPIGTAIVEWDLFLAELKYKKKRSNGCY
jgi:hypothetical protein